MDLVTEMLRVCAALERAGVRFAVCGGVAVTAYGAPRSTDDLDVLIHPDDLERATAAVTPEGYQFADLPLLFDEGTEREREVRRITKVEGGRHLMLDFLLARGSLAPALDQPVRVELEAGSLTLVRRDALIEMKRMAGRAKDLADLEALADLDESGEST